MTNGKFHNSKGVKESTKITIDLQGPTIQSAGAGNKTIPIPVYSRGGLKNLAQAGMESAAAVHELVKGHPEFRIELPKALFNDQSMIDKLTFWPDVWLYRIPEKDSA